MNISDYLRTALLNHTLDIATYVPPTGIWAALYTSAPNNTGGGVEVSATDYRRVSTTWGTAVDGVIQNSVDIDFPITGTTQSTWGAVTALGLFDSSTHGNLLFYGPLSAVVTLNLGDDFKVTANSLTITLA